MAHCDSHMSDLTRLVGPAAGSVAKYDALSPGANAGLGCSSNLNTVACTFASSSPPNLVVYGNNGERLFEDAAGLLNSNAGKSAPIVFLDGTVLAADNTRLILFNADGTVKWNSAKIDTGSPISPVLVGTDMVLTATNGAGTLSTWDLNDGRLLGTFVVNRSGICDAYQTLNTPAVNGSRAYVVMNCGTDTTMGLLVAIDIDTSSTSVRGKMTQIWFYEITGPSGSSPLFDNGQIYLDQRDPSDSSKGFFMAIKDLGSSPQLLWNVHFGSKFVASAAKDPRGGLWVFPALYPDLYRLNAADGTVLQQIPIHPLPGTVGPYSPCSALTVSYTSAKAVVLTFGTRSKVSGEPAAVMSIDVTNARLLWQTEVTFNGDGNHAFGQFPIVRSSGGAPWIAFAGSKSGTFFIGQP
jgi:hypothetical protein